MITLLFLVSPSSAAISVIDLQRHFATCMAGQRQITIISAPVTAQDYESCILLLCQYLGFCRCWRWPSSPIRSNFIRFKIGATHAAPTVMSVNIVQHHCSAPPSQSSILFGCCQNSAKDELEHKPKFTNEFLFFTSISNTARATALLG